MTYVRLDVDSVRIWEEFDKDGLGELDAFMQHAVRQIEQIDRHVLQGQESSGYPSKIDAVFAVPTLWSARFAQTLNLA